ncbi:hypothetical protein L7F22_065103 [Adiantum nelumboides]|nr:hypothetical protein [Adiantum nelumboides]
MLSNMNFDDAASPPTSSRDFNLCEWGPLSLVSSFLAHLCLLSFATFADCVTCRTEADPNLLARYITALLKNNKPKKELEAFCIEKLIDFLGDEAKFLVHNLFHALEKGTISKLKNDCSDNVAEVSSTIPDTEGARLTGEAACIGGVTNGSRCSHLKKLHEVDSVVTGNLEDEGSDYEDNDKNPKHRRRVSTSHSASKVESLESFLSKEHDKVAIDGGPPTYDRSFFAVESSKGCNVFTAEKNDAPKGVLLWDRACSSPSRHVRENSQHCFSTEAMHLRDNGLCSSFGRLARCDGGGFPEPPVAPEQRTSVDRFDLNLPLLSFGPAFSPYSGKPTASLLNASQSSWPGIGTVPHRQLFSLNQAVQTAMSSSTGRLRCSDFEERGYCLRGDLCPMEHGANRIVVRDFQSLSKLSLPLATPSECNVTLNSSPIFTSSSTSHFFDPILFTRDSNLPLARGLYFSKGTLPDNDFPEPDLYDPEQPLFNTVEPFAFANGMKRPSSFGKGLQGILGVSKRCKVETTIEGRFKRSLTAMPLGLTHDQSVLSHESENSHNVDSKVQYFAGCIKAESETAVESYEPESVHEKLLTEEQEIKVKSAIMKPGISSAHQRVGLMSHSKGITATEAERAHRTLYVGCIPNTNNKKELLNAHFQRFGEIVDIRIPLQGDRAFIQFSRREEAEAALRSPEAVMGNRFVRLSWAKRDNVPFSLTGSGLAAASTSAQCSSGIESQVSQGLISEALLIKAKQAVSMPALHEPNCLTKVGKSVGPSFQTLALASSLKKQQELEHTIEELRRKQDELAHKREVFRRQLERYSKQGFGVAAGVQKDQNSSISSTGSKGESNRAENCNKQLTLESLENGTNKSYKETSALSASIEKALLPADFGDSGVGKDTIKITLGPAHRPILTQVSHQRGMKGLLVGPGVSFAGASQSSPMFCNLDNSSTTFHVLPPLPDGLVDVSLFAEHFSCFGEVSNVEVDDVNKGVKVTFHTRRAAEKAFLQGRCYQGTSLCFSWVKQSSSITAAVSSVDTVTADAAGKSIGYNGCKAVAGLRLEEANVPNILRVFGGDDSQAAESIITKVDSQLLEPNYEKRGNYLSLKITPTLDSVDTGSMSGVCRAALSF